MIDIPTTQQSQTRESTGEHTPSGSAQVAPPCMIEYDINAVVRGQHRGHLKGIGRQLARMASSASSAATRSSTSVPGPTPAIPDLVHQQVTGMLQSYQQYLQFIVSQVMPGFQLPLMLTMSMPTPPVVPPQQGPGQPDDDEDFGTDGPTNLGASQDFFFIGF